MVGVHDVQIWIKDPMHTAQAFLFIHYATSVNSSLIWMDSSGYLRTGQGICNMPQYLLAGLDVWRGTRAAPRSCHDVTCPDINLDFPEAQPEVGCETHLGNCNMEQDTSLTENWLVHRDSKSPRLLSSTALWLAPVHQWPWLWFICELELTV